MLGRADQPIPILIDIFGRAADFSNHLGDLFRGNHFDRIPRTDVTPCFSCIENQDDQPAPPDRPGEQRRDVFRWQLIAEQPGGDD